MKEKDVHATFHSYSYFVLLFFYCYITLFINLYIIQFNIPAQIWAFFKKNCFKVPYLCLQHSLFVLVQMMFGSSGAFTLHRQVKFQVLFECGGSSVGTSANFKISLTFPRVIYIYIYESNDYDPFHTHTLGSIIWSFN